MLRTPLILSFPLVKVCHIVNFLKDFGEVQTSFQVLSPIQLEMNPRGLEEVLSLPFASS